MPNASKDANADYGLPLEHVLEFFFFLFVPLLELLLFIDCTLELRHNELLMDELDLL